MKECKKCGISVGNAAKRCPLCGSSLTGWDKDKREFFPIVPKERKRYIFYKVQLLIFWAVFLFIILFTLIADYRSFFGKTFLVLLWLIIGEVTFTSIWRSHLYIPGIIFRCAVAGMLALGLSSLWYPAVIPIIPSPLIPLLILNLIAALGGRDTNVVVCFMVNLAAIIFSWIVVVLILKDTHILIWQVSFLTGILTLLIILVFRGRTLFGELKKRLHL